MTRCFNTSLTRIGANGGSSATRVGGEGRATFTRVGDGQGTMASAVGDVSCSLSPVCRASIVVRYLDISPKVVWLLAGHTENDVYSNTRWHID